MWQFLLTARRILPNPQNVLGGSLEQTMRLVSFLLHKLTCVGVEYLIIKREGTGSLICLFLFFGQQWERRRSFRRQEWIWFVHDG